MRPAIRIDVTLTLTTYLGIVTDRAHPFMETVLPDGCGFIQERCEEHSNECEVLTKPPNSSDLNPVEHLWDALDKQVGYIVTPDKAYVVISAGRLD